MGTSDSVLIDKMDKTIVKLEQPTEGTCPSHGPLSEGLSLLLQIERTRLAEKPTDANMIRYGNLTISGGLAITAVVVGYLVLKIHGITP